eukprot:5782776-Pleurochrysis_carterae.AAC.2
MTLKQRRAAPSWRALPMQNLRKTSENQAEDEASGSGDAESPTQLCSEADDADGGSLADDTPSRMDDAES